MSYLYYIIYAVARSVLTKRPINVVVEAGTNVTLECASDTSASSIIWRHDSVPVTGPQCTTTDPRFTTSTDNRTECYLTTVGNYGVQGPYTCSDGSLVTALAVVTVIGKS